MEIIIVILLLIIIYLTYSDKNIKDLKGLFMPKKNRYDKEFNKTKKETKKEIALEWKIAGGILIAFTIISMIMTIDRHYEQKAMIEGFKTMNKELDKILINQTNNIFKQTRKIIRP